MSKSTLRILLAVMVAISALVAHPVFGEPITPPNTLLVFTELSDTVLTATTTGGVAFGTVSFTSLDHWTWMLPADRPNVAGITQFLIPPSWLEPDVPAVQRLANQVAPNFFGSPPNFVGGAFINSDVDFSQSANVLVPDGTIVPAYFEFSYVDDSSETFDVQFIDKGDVASVPDTGTTASLFGLSLAGLAFLRRKILA